MEELFFLDPCGDAHPQRIVPLEHADTAVAPRANLTTSKAEYAAIELFQPKRRAFGGGHCLQFCDIDKTIFGVFPNRFPNQ
jgi:hypothetical protein